MVRFGRMTVLVRDLDVARDFYVNGIGFEVLFDGEVAPGLRTVHVGTEGVGLWLLAANHPASEDRVGQQTAEEPAMVLYTEDLATDLTRLATIGCEPIQPPGADASGSRFAHVRDVSGNEIVLVQLPSQVNDET